MTDTSRERNAATLNASDRAGGAGQGLGALETDSAQPAAPRAAAGPEAAQ